jgi:hypothetical protein
MSTEQPQSLTVEDVKGAAIAGIRLLNDKDLKVPMDLAIAGSLGHLRALLVAVANGQLVFVPPPEPKLHAIEGDRKDANA